MKGSVKILVAPAAAASAEWRLKDHMEITEVALSTTAVEMAMEEVDVATAAAAEAAAAAMTTSPSV